MIDTGLQLDTLYVTRSGMDVEIYERLAWNSPGQPTHYTFHGRTFDGDVYEWEPDGKERHADSGRELMRSYERVSLNLEVGKWYRAACGSLYHITGVSGPAWSRGGSGHNYTGEGGPNGSERFAADGHAYLYSNHFLVEEIAEPQKRKFRVTAQIGYVSMTVMAYDAGTAESAAHDALTITSDNSDVEIDDVDKQGYEVELDDSDEQSTQPRGV